LREVDGVGEDERRGKRTGRNVIGGGEAGGGSRVEMSKEVECLGLLMILLMKTVLGMR
jgi:hypothetical protein